MHNYHVQRVAEPFPGFKIGRIIMDGIPEKWIIFLLRRNDNGERATVYQAPDGRQYWSLDALVQARQRYFTAEGTTEETVRALFNIPALNATPKRREPRAPRRKSTKNKADEQLSSVVEAKKPRQSDEKVELMHVPMERKIEVPVGVIVTPVPAEPRKPAEQHSIIHSTRHSEELPGKSQKHEMSPAALVPVEAPVAVVTLPAREVSDSAGKVILPRNQGDPALIFASTRGFPQTYWATDVDRSAVARSSPCAFALPAAFLSEAAHGSWYASSNGTN